MKRLILGIAAIMMMVMSGCGDASVVVTIPFGQAILPPEITSYQFTKQALTLLIDGDVVFYAPQSDIGTITVTVFDSRGFEVSRTRTALNLPGAVRGTIPFSIDYAAYPAGMYTLSIYLTDLDGLTSNQIVDTFGVP